MVYIVAALPPSHRQATAEVRDEQGDEAIHGEVRCDGQMTGIMRGEHNLVLE